jgi:hypothetical protein
MNATVRRVLDSFDALSDEEQYEVTLEVLRRASRWPAQELTEEGLLAAADDLFRELDEREATDAGSSPR